MSMIGKTLAHYEITSQLGKGGMGEVYQAKDRKLGRDVAIKVLPEEFARDTDRVARFQREAKLLASLNHPNIAAIHGLEESEGTNFLVLELVEGETLADRIKAGPIPVEESLKLALQIAEALEAAHEKGVIHRDLKPANIKVTPDGKVKVLDFGLAKAFAGEQAELNLSNSPTLSDAATQQGVILGTAAYMSPEQARGKTVDKRADIWAFGCVLYEMLTGRVAFQGDDVSEIFASVIKGDVKLDLLPANLHTRVREVITRCLQKDLKKRYHDIADVRYEIEQALADPSGVLVQPVTTVELRSKLRTILPWVAAVIGLSVITGVVIWNLRKPEPRQVTRFVHYLTEDQQFANLVYPLLAVCPEGRQFAYCTTGGLFLSSMGEWDARRVSIANEYAVMPFFSPDGQWVGYVSLTDGKLKKVSIIGGAPVPLCDVANATVLGASWGANDTIVYSQPRKGIMRISGSGGIPETLIPSEKKDLYHPRLLPDGKSMLFTLGTNEGYKIAVQSLESRERTVLFKGDYASYLPTGHIIYAVENNLYAVPFNLDTLQTTGASVSVVEGLFRTSAIYTPQYAFSVSGTLIYLTKVTTAAATGSTLVWVDRYGKEEPVEAPPNLNGSLRISPDGKRVALAATIGGNDDIWVWDFARKTLSRLTFDKDSDDNPLWTLDGKRIAFSSRRDGNSGVYWKEADGTGKDELVGSAYQEAETYAFPLSWSGDGKTLVLMENFFPTGKSDYNIGALTTEGDRKYRRLLKEKYHESQPQISPSGRWMAYVSNESGQAQIYVRPFPEVDAGRWQVSTSGGNSPLWSRDGRELFYRSGDAVMLVPVKTEPTFSFETPKILFRGAYRPGASLSPYQWDVSPDGKRFLMMKVTGSTALTGGGAQKINIVLNWFEELKQRMPVK